MNSRLRTTHNIGIDYAWVQGHQDTNPIRDKEGKVLPLTRAAKINIDCDMRAGKYQTDPAPDRIPRHNPVIPTAANVYFSSKGQTNIGALEAQVMMHRHEETMKQKLMEKFDWTAEIFHTINWPQHGEAVRKINKTLYVNIMKSNFG